MRRVGAVALVLVGIWVLTQALLFLNLPISEFVAGAGGGVRRLIAVLPALGAALLGVWLIVRRRQLAERWFDEDGPEVRIDGLSLLRAGILVIAVSAFVGGITSLLFGCTRLFVDYGRESGIGTGEMLRILAPQLVVGVAGIVVGLVLIAVSRPLSRRLWAGPRRPLDTRRA